ncbi:hypothetical protein [Candidatus Methylopumilus planktonicus]|uniref:hypothetical protein n=1 Tax=Candidatus Methylopumilus planktonicus TaxID=1581557 RepID=UPI003BEEFEB5
MINYLIAFIPLVSHVIGYNNISSIFLLFSILSLYSLQNFNQQKFNLTSFILAIFICIIGLLGVVSISLAIVLISSFALWKHDRFKLILTTILFLELPFTFSIEGFLFNKLSFFNAGFLSPFIVSTFVLGLLLNSYSFFRKCFLAIFLAFLGLRYLPFSTIILDLFLLLPLIYVFLSAFKINNLQEDYVLRQSNFKGFLTLLIFLVSFHSFSFSPNLSSNYYYYLPDIKNSYEAKFFVNYDDALSFTGKKFSRIESLSEVPEGSVVLYPWITEDDPKIDTKEIRAVAMAKKLTLILIGEHTNYSNNANIINSITNTSTLNNDLTVPEFNSDESGHLRSSDFREWPANSIFNRGASLNLGFLDLLLLSGDHWWLEKNIGEWLWIGDYIREEDDRYGRVPLGMALNDGNSRFVVFGDTSAFMNFQIIANPTAFNRLVDLASCKFSFLKALLLLSIIFIYLRHPKIKVPLFTIIIFIFSTFYFSNYKNSDKWDYFNVGQSGFNRNNFNKKLAEFNQLSKLNMKRSRYLNSHAFYKEEDSIHFGLIDHELILKDLSVSDCRRMGLVDTSDFTLMDGQTCRISGNAEPLAGSLSSAPAVKFNYRGYTKILIFDVGFLSEHAPEKNISWLLSNSRK